MHSQSFCIYFEFIFFSFASPIVSPFQWPEWRRKKKFNETLPSLVPILACFHHTRNHSLIIHCEHSINMSEIERKWAQKESNKQKYDELFSCYICVSCDFFSTVSQHYFRKESRWILFSLPFRVDCVCCTLFFTLPFPLFIAIVSLKIMLANRHKR